MPQATPTENNDSATRFSFPTAHRKKITAAFDGGRLTSDGGVLLLAQAERGMGICDQLAGCIADRRDPTRVIHTLPNILRARIFTICCGYEDADDLDTLRDDPGFRLALGKLPGAGAGLVSQPTMSRWENAPTTRELVRMMAAMIGIYCSSYPDEPAAVTLDIDDTCDVVHGYAATLLDSACGIAVHSQLDIGQGYTTLELKVAYHRKLSDDSGRVRAIGRVVSMGRRVAFAEATLHDGKGRLCASATSTLLVFEHPN